MRRAQTLLNKNYDRISQLCRHETHRNDLIRVKWNKCKQTGSGSILLYWKVTCPAGSTGVAASPGFRWVSVLLSIRVHRNCRQFPSH
jgi:hypothetical protein